ncbi:hypothetical protein SDC9_63192 [bioreactor metagenome]|uniref:DUF1697 domain-containing protein n=1 Tax=bioreactor metagenome TaxID=1076179 RepID=A0A644XKU6_9ZZZZ
MKIRYVALLRGINVGGKNVIRMKELKSAFEQCGFNDVGTYIQSGNVIFSSDEVGFLKIRKKIEIRMKKLVGTEIHLVLLPAKEFRKVITEAPDWFGTEPEKYKYDVAFLDPEINADSLLSKISLRDGVDRAAAGNGVLYFSKLIEKATQSRLPKMISLPEYQMMTIRNRNTTLKLSELL